MSARLVLVAAAIGVAGVTGCAMSAPVSCEEIERDPPPPLSCPAAVNAARERLAAVPGVTGLRFQYDECAPNADRCEFLFGTAGNVIASLADGSEVAVFVGIDDTGVVRVDGVRPFAPLSEPTPVP